MLTDAARASTPYQIVLVDEQLPDMDGAGFSGRIRSITEMENVQLLILLSLDSGIAPETLREKGFAGYLTKPVRQSQLFDGIMDAVAASRGAACPSTSRPVTRAARRGFGSRTAARGVRVLVADDNDVNRMVAGEILSMSGYEWDAVCTGRQAVTEALKGRHDIILMDCQMPDLDGYEATRVIREAEANGTQVGRGTKPVPIIALTANAIKGDREKCLEAGMDDYITKPMNPRALIQLLEKHLSIAPTPSPAAPQRESGDAAPPGLRAVVASAQRAT